MSDIPDTEVVPGGPAHEPQAPEQVALGRMDLWLSQLEAAPPAMRSSLRPEDLDAERRAAAFRRDNPEMPPPVDLLAALQDAWARMWPDGRVTEADAKAFLEVLGQRVLCPNCGGYQVYDLAEKCWACGGAAREGRRGGHLPGSGEAVSTADGYDPDVRVFCADPKCVQWGSACSNCGAQPDPDRKRDPLAPRGRHDARGNCTACRTPWPRTRTRWATGPKGVCGGPDGDNPDVGCGWVRA